MLNFYLACFDLNLDSENKIHDIKHEYEFHEFPLLADGLPAHKELK